MGLSIKLGKLERKLGEGIDCRACWLRAHQSIGVPPVIERAIDDLQPELHCCPECGKTLHTIICESPFSRAELDRQHQDD